MRDISFWQRLQTSVFSMHEMLHALRALSDVTIRMEKLHSSATYISLKVCLYMAQIFAACTQAHLIFRSVLDCSSLFVTIGNFRPNAQNAVDSPATSDFNTNGVRHFKQCQNSTSLKSFTIFFCKFLQNLGEPSNVSERPSECAKSKHVITIAKLLSLSAVSTVLRQRRTLTKVFFSRLIAFAER